MAGWPDSTNTGVPDGVILSPSGSITITKDGTVIDALNVQGSIYVQADNVTIKNSQITSSNFAVIQIANGSTGTVVENCEINGLNSGGQGISGMGTFIGNDIHGVADGINVTGDHVLIQDNYIHDLGGTADSHFDGIQVDGGVSDLTIEHNTIINNHSQTAAVMIDDYFGSTSNVVVNNNLLAGGGYTIYVTGLDGHGTTNVQVTGNHVGGGQWGDTYFAAANPTYTGNMTDGESLVSTLNGNGNITDGSSTTITQPVAPPPVTEPIVTPDPIPTPTPTPTPTDTSATSGADHLVGDAGNNVIDGLGGNDFIDGGAGNDTLIGGAGYDTLTGGSGNDIFAFNNVSDIGRFVGARDVITDFTQGQDKIDLSGIDANSKLDGHQAFTFVEGDDTIFTHTPGEVAWHTEAANGITVVQGDVDGDGVHDFEFELKGTVSLKASDFIGVNTTSSPDATVTQPVTTPPPTTTAPSTDSGLNIVTGTDGRDRLSGTSGDDYLDGKAGSDRLHGGSGDDVLNGGTGRDYMTGGSGHDVFVFTTASDSGTNWHTRDVITDFTQGQDKIDLSAIDANSKVSGNQAFTFLSGDNQAFTHTAGEVAWHIDTAHNNTIIQADTNGDGVHDFEIQLTGAIHLGAGDFIF